MTDNQAFDTLHHLDPYDMDPQNRLAYLQQLYITILDRDVDNQLSAVSAAAFYRVADRINQVIEDLRSLL